MKLTARQVETAKPKDKPYKLADGGGLYLLVNPNGKRYWRLKYRSLGKEKLLAIGVYPDVEVVDRPEQLAKGVDPGIEKAVEVLLKELEKNPPKQVKVPEPPNRSGWIEKDIK